MEQNKPQTEQELSQQAAVRRQKLADLCEAGHNPFEITKYAQDAYSADLKQEFAELPAEAETGKIVSLAGRMMSKRVMGKAAFATVRDFTGEMQYFVTPADVGDEAYALFKSLDLGDIVAAEGTLFRTNKGELSVRVKKLRLMTKSIRPLPDKHKGLTDVEACCRQRYTDLIINEESRKRFATRFKAVSAVRRFMEEHRFVEVETPMLNPIPGQRQTLHHASKRARYRSVPSHCAGTLSQASCGGRF